jgi:putative tricarboxylic transport membrane protein
VKRGWLVASAACLVFFTIAGLQSLALPLNDELGPGPGFFPLALAAIGMVLSLLLVLEMVRAPVEEEVVSLVPDRGAILRMLSVLVMLVFAAGLLNLLGWRLTALIATAALLPALGARSPLVIAVFALAASFGVFHVFYHWLKVPLPIGSFGI